MRSKRLLQAACAVAAGALALCATPLRGGDVTVVVTKVDDGDAKPEVLPNVETVFGVI